MSNSIFGTEDGRKSAFMMLYKEQKYDIVEIANKLDIKVGTSQTMPDDILGFIRYKNNKFEIVVNNNKKIDEPMTNARIQTTIAHEVAHWIYDYDDMVSNQKIFCESVNDIFDDLIESRAIKVATNIILGISNPLV
jgi:Zn-dependent peptidase ImmA (M78 family)